MKLTFVNDMLRGLALALVSDRVGTMKRLAEAKKTNWRHWSCMLDQILIVFKCSSLLKISGRCNCHCNDAGGGWWWLVVVVVVGGAGAGGDGAGDWCW